MYFVRLQHTDVLSRGRGVHQSVHLSQGSRDPRSKACQHHTGSIEEPYPSDVQDDCFVPKSTVEHQKLYDTYETPTRGYAHPPSVDAILAISHVGCVRQLIGGHLLFVDCSHNFHDCDLRMGLGLGNYSVTDIASTQQMKREQKVPRGDVRIATRRAKEKMPSSQLPFLGLYGSRVELNDGSNTKKIQYGLHIFQLEYQGTKFPYLARMVTATATGTTPFQTAARPPM